MDLFQGSNLELYQNQQGEACVSLRDLVRWANESQGTQIRYRNIRDRTLARLSGYIEFGTPAQIERQLVFGNGAVQTVEDILLNEYQSTIIASKIHDKFCLEVTKEWMEYRRRYGELQIKTAVQAAVKEALDKQREVFFSKDYMTVQAFCKMKDYHLDIAQVRHIESLAQQATKQYGLEYLTGYDDFRYAIMEFPVMILDQILEDYSKSKDYNRPGQDNEEHLT